MVAHRIHRRARRKGIVYVYEVIARRNRAFPRSDRRKPLVKTAFLTVHYARHENCGGSATQVQQWRISMTGKEQRRAWTWQSSF